MTTAASNSERNTKVQIELDRITKAKAIRIYPKKWYMYPCLRFDAYFITN